MAAVAAGRAAIHGRHRHSRKPAVDVRLLYNRTPERTASDKCGRSAGRAQLDSSQQQQIVGDDWRPRRSQTDACGWLEWRRVDYDPYHSITQQESLEEANVLAECGVDGHTDGHLDRTRRPDLSAPSVSESAIQPTQFPIRGCRGQACTNAHQAELDHGDWNGTYIHTYIHGQAACPCEGANGHH